MLKMSQVCTLFRGYFHHFFFFFNLCTMTKRIKIELSGKEGMRRVSGKEINVAFPRASWAEHSNAGR